MIKKNVGEQKNRGEKRDVVVLQEQSDAKRIWPVYECFKQGLGTKDLRDAARILRQLSVRFASVDLRPATARPPYSECLV
jgi:hypothetical protein